MKDIKNKNKLNLLLIVIILLCINLLSTTVLIAKLSNNNNYNINFDKVSKSVVSIDAYSGLNINKKGTGFIYKTDKEYAYILTNNHIVDDATDIRIYVLENQKVEGKILGFSRYLDVAVIRIKNNNYESLEIYKKNNLNSGDKVYTIGTPLSNEFYNTLSSGIISNPSRFRIENNSNVDTLMNMIQMNMIINPGNSGAPLFNSNLEVIGICTSSISTDEINSISFAVPITSVINKLDELESGEVELPKIGNIKITDLSDSEQLYSNGLIDKTSETIGVIVLNDDKEVSLKKGDIIKEINNEEIKDMNYYEYNINKYSKGEKINLTIVRDSKIKKIKVLLK